MGGTKQVGAVWPTLASTCSGRLLRKANMARVVMPSRPGEFHPSPSQIPDVNLSIYPARVTARRLPPSAEPLGSSQMTWLAQAQRR